MKRLSPTLTTAATWLMGMAMAALMAAEAVAQERPRLRVMEWNVENLFDTLHDEGFRDEEFLPQSTRHWTGGRLWRKVNDIARVVATVAEEHGMPDLVGLCEVENDSVMVLLNRRSALRHLGFDYVMTHSADARGIDVALLYQPVHFRLLESHSIRIPSAAHGFAPTRDILYAKGLTFTTDGIDTLHVLVTHLPSRAGGSRGDRHRQLAAATLWSTIDSLQHATPSARIVCMGDFNASAHDRIFRHAPLRLTDARRDPGTYCYRGAWQWLDHVLVSSPIATPAAACSIRLPWLLEEGQTYGGTMPRRTFRGPTYHGGVSDHLPIFITLEM